jgi:DNA-binding transcriptional LysR family regulator
MTTIDASTSVASEVAQFSGRNDPPAASAYGLPVEIASFSTRLCAVARGRLVMIVAAQGSGRRSGFTAWAAASSLSVKHLRADDLETHDATPQAADDDHILLIEAVGHHALPAGSLDGLKSRARAGRSVFILTNDYSFATACWEADPASVSLIDWDDIQVTATEAQQIAAQHGNRPSSIADTCPSELNNWLFGICLVARSKLHHQTGSFPRAIQSYMRRNILCKLPADMQTLLKVAAVSTHAEVACSAAHLSQASQLIEAHLGECLGFVRRESADRFNLHPLFQKYLLSELADDMASAETVAILRDGTDARVVLQLMIKAGRHEDAAVLLAKELSLAPKGARLPRARVLLEGVDAEATRPHPLLCFWKAELVRSESTAASRSLFMVAAEGYLARGQLDLAISSWARACSQIGMGYQAGKDLDESTEWMEHVDQSIPDAQWYLRFPGVVSTMEVDLSMSLLKSYVRLVERGSITLAAQDLGLSQPTVSRHLSDLERIYQVNLLVRSTRALNLTPTGQHLYDRAVEILDAERKLRESMNQNRTRPAGKIKIYAHTAFGPLVVAPFCARFLAHHPEMSLDLCTRTAKDVNLVAEGVDVSVHVGELAESCVNVQPLATLSVIPVVSGALVGRAQVPRQPSDLTSLPWITCDAMGGNAPIRMHRGDRHAKVVPEARMTTTDIGAHKSALVAGGGGGMIYECMVAQELADGTLVRLLPDWSAAATPVHLVFANANKADSVQAWCNELRVHLGQLAGVMVPPAHVH